jgi:hypothetical protein
VAKDQTRRSISVKGLTYQRLSNWCEKNGRTRSGLVEDLLIEFLDIEGEPTPEILLPKKPKEKKEVEEEEIISSHFTF